MMLSRAGGCCFDGETFPGEAVNADVVNCLCEICRTQPSFLPEEVMQMMDLQLHELIAAVDGEL